MSPGIKGTPHVRPGLRVGIPNPSEEWMRENDPPGYEHITLFSGGGYIYSRTPEADQPFEDERMQLPEWKASGGDEAGRRASAWAHYGGQR
jgi:hypothetical protein